MILAEVDNWIVKAKKDEANYTDGLTTSHNQSISLIFQKSRDAYHDTLVDLRKELIAEFALLDSPYRDSSVKTTALTKTS